MIAASSAGMLADGRLLRFFAVTRSSAFVYMMHCISAFESRQFSLASKPILSREAALRAYRSRRYVFFRRVISFSARCLDDFVSDILAGRRRRFLLEVSFSD